MCKIASLFLLQMLKGSMLGDVLNFNNIKTQAIIKVSSSKARRRRKFTPLGEHAPSYATVKNWVTQFKHGDFSTCDVPHPG
jgi:hypothetical protein